MDSTCQAPLVVGAGFIGGHLVEALATAGREPRVLTRTMPARFRSHTPVHVADASDVSTLRAVLDGVDHIFYCAGGAMPSASNLDPSADVAAVLPPLITVLEALRERTTVGLTYLSSGGTVYGRPRTLPVSEDHQTEPLNSYGILKLASEKYVQMYADLYGVSARVLRCSNVYGPGQPTGRDQGFVAAALECLTEHRPLVLYDDGRAVRDFVAVADVVDVMIRLADRPGGPTVLNVGSGVGWRIRDVLGLLEAETQTRALVTAAPRRGLDVDEIVLDITRLQATLPFTPLGLEEGLRHLLVEEGRATAA